MDIPQVLSITAVIIVKRQKAAHKGLAKIVAAMVPLCFGGVHVQQQLLAQSLLHTLTDKQQLLTTGFCKCDAAGDEHFFSTISPPDFIARFN